jgi:DNA-binding transcriptional ArsR family regulator
MSRPETDHIARLSFAMGHPRRVALFDLLSARPETGNSLAALENASKIPRASLIYHLRRMESVGLVRRRAKGSSTEFTLVRSALSPLKSAVASRAYGTLSAGIQPPKLKVYT